MPIRFLDQPPAAPAPVAKPAGRIRFLDETVATSTPKVRFLDEPSQALPKTAGRVRFLDESPAQEHISTIVPTEEGTAPGGDSSIPNAITDIVRKIPRPDSLLFGNRPDKLLTMPATELPKVEELGQELGAQVKDPLRKKIRDMVSARAAERNVGVSARFGETELARPAPVLDAALATAADMAVDFIPTTPTETAAYTLTGPALEFLGQGLSKVFPKAAQFLTEPHNLQYALNEIKYKLGIPTETALQPMDVAEAFRSGRISEAEAARMDESFYQQALKRRLLTPEDPAPGAPAKSSAAGAPVPAPVAPAVPAEMPLNEADLPSPAIQQTILARTGGDTKFYLPSIGLSAGDTMMAQATTSLAQAFDLTPQGIADSLSFSAKTYENVLAQGGAPEMAEMEANKAFWGAVPLGRSLAIAFPQAEPGMLEQYVEMLKTGDAQASRDVLEALAEQHANLKAMTAPIQEAQKISAAHLSVPPVAEPVPPVRPPQEAAAGADPLDYMDEQRRLSAIVKQKFPGLKFPEGPINYPDYIAERKSILQSMGERYPGLSVSKPDRTIPAISSPPPSEPPPPPTATGSPPQPPDDGNKFGPASRKNKGVIPKILEMAETQSINPAKEKLFGEMDALRQSLQRQAATAKETYRFAWGQSRTIQKTLGAYIKSVLPATAQQKYLYALANLKTPASAVNLIERIDAEATKVPEKRVKKTIEEVTNVSPMRRVLNIREDAALEAQLRAEVKGSQAGFKEGKRVTKELLQEKFRQGEEAVEAVVDYIKEQLPVSERGKYIQAITKARTPARQYSIFRRINDQVAKMEAGTMDKQIKKLADPSGSVDVQYQKMIMDKIRDIDLAKMSPQKQKELKSLGEFIKREGQKLGISDARVAEVERLTKTPLSQMSMGDKNELRETLKILNSLGKLKRELKLKYNARELAVAKTRLIESTQNIDPTSSGDTEKDRLKLRWGKYGTDVLHTPRVADQLDAYQNYKGENAKYIKRLGAIENKAKGAQLDRMANVLDTIGKIVPELSESDMQKIVFYLHKEQGAFDQAQMLINSLGWKTEPAMTDQYRKIIDAIRPLVDNYDRIAPVYEETRNEIMGRVKNYFPLKYVEREPTVSDIADLIRDSFRKTQAFRGFTFERKPHVKQVPRTDLLNIIWESLGEQEWYTNFQPELENIKYLFSSPEYLKAAGKLGTNFWLDTMDIIARRGLSANFQPNPLLKKARINLQQAILGFKATSALIQPLAVTEAVAYAQAQYGARVSAEILKEFVKTWVNPNYAQSIIDQSPALRLREGAGEMAISETLDQAKTKSLFSKVLKASLYPLRRADVITAAGVQQAFENILKKSGAQNPKEESEFLMNVVSGSNDVVYRPHVLAYGEGARTWLTFQNFALNQWGIIWHDIIKSGIGHGEGVKQKLNAALGLMVSISGILAANEARKKIMEVTSGKEYEDKTSTVFDALTAIPSAVPFFGSLFDAGISYYTGRNYSAMPPTLKTLEDISKGTAGMFLAKKRISKIKAGIKAARGTSALFFGIPGTYQIAEILQRAVASSAAPKKASRKAEFATEFKKENLGD